MWEPIGGLLLCAVSSLNLPFWQVDIIVKNIVLSSFIVQFPPEHRSRKQLCDNRQPLMPSENPELAILEFKPTQRRGFR